MLSRVVSLSFFSIVLAVAATVTGLQQQSEVKLTAQMANAPFAGDTPPQIWAISFSPDGKRLVYGVEFVRKKDLSFRSYLLVVSTDRPEIVLKRFETTKQSLTKSLHTIVWSLDGRLFVVTPYGDWESAALIDLQANQLRFVPYRAGVPWCANAASMLSGPRIVQQCSDSSGSTVIRFIGMDGQPAPEWKFPSAAGLLDVSSNRELLALDVHQPPRTSSPRAAHKILILKTSDRSEVRRWSLPQATYYSGAFAQGGTDFCALADANDVTLKHEIVCRSIVNGEVTSRNILPRGPVGIVTATAGNRLVLRRFGVTISPFRLFGTNYFLTHENGSFLDLRTGHEIAHWRVNDFKKGAVASEFAVSTDGHLVAVGEPGQVRIYRVSS